MRLEVSGCPSSEFIPFLLDLHSMFARILRRLMRSKKAPVRARSRSWPRFIPSFDRLEERVNPGSASPTNVSMLYDVGAHSLSVSFQQALGSSDTPVYGAVFLEPAEPAAGG